MGALLGQKMWKDILIELKELNNPAVNIVIRGFEYNKDNDVIRSEYVTLIGKLWQTLIRDKEASQ